MRGACYFGSDPVPSVEMCLLKRVRNDKVDDEVEAVMEDTEAMKDAESDGISDDILIWEYKQGVDWVQGKGKTSYEKYSNS